MARIPVHHETTLISTIAIGLVYAVVGGYLATRVGLPPLVGYLLAGVAEGPFTGGFVADTRLAPQLAEIGVILLMFGVGLHFSFRDLWAVRNIAIPGALSQIAVAVALGFGTARLWGWNAGAALVFGLALSVASTVVLLRALEARGLLRSISGQVAVGWLIVEDLVVVLILVFLPIFAQEFGGQAASHGAIHSTAALPGGEVLATLAIAIAKFAGFGAFMLLIGARLLPWFLRQIARLPHRELYSVAVIASALGISLAAAELFGLSFALGAFFAGVVIGESDQSHRADLELRPVQEAFTALFFVAIGMLFDPAVLIRMPFQLLAVLTIILFGKSLAAFLIVLLFRHTIATALVIAASLAQIGEFSFILAEIGVGLRLLPAEGQSLIIAAALFSIGLNSLLMKAAASIQVRFEARQALAS